MRDAAGFAALHAVLIGTGFAALRGLGILRAPYDVRSLGAALGPALVVGAALVVPLLIVLLVMGIPLTLVTMVLVALGCVAVAEAVARSAVFAGPRAPLPAAGAGAGRGGPSAIRWFERLGLAVAGIYVAFGAFALARAPTVGDDARIWSLKGLTLFYYHDLRPEIFLNPTQAGAHPVYPLFQPLLEAMLSRAMASPQLRLYHTEVWFLFAATIWTAGYAIARSSSRAGAARLAWCPVLALVAVAPAAGVYDVVLGDTDIVGSLMLGVGTLSLGLWLDHDDRRFLALGAVLLAAAANTKDEDLVASMLVLITCLAVALIRRNVGSGAAQLRERLVPWLAAVMYYAVVAAPWRIWLAALASQTPLSHGSLMPSILSSSFSAPPSSTHRQPRSSPRCFRSGAGWRQRFWWSARFALSLRSREGSSCSISRASCSSSWRSSGCIQRRRST